MVFLALTTVLGLISFSSAIPVTSRDGTAAAYCTSSDLSRKLTSITAPVRGSGSSSAWTLKVDDSSAGHKQTITGFGAAVTDATASTLNELSDDVLNHLLDELLTSAGADFALMRHTIGASDMSPDPAYTYDDSGGHADPPLDNFGLGASGTAMAELLAKMKQMNGDLTVLGSPWSAPGWMKLNNALIGDAMDNSLSDGYLSPNQTDYSAAFAQYFVKYIQAYRKLGVNIDYLTIQNEPLNSQSGYPTMYMYDYEQGDLIQNHIGPALASAGLDTAIWAYDHNTDVPSYPQNVLNTASQYVSTVAWHCYASNVDWTVLSSFHASNPGVKQYMTECWTPQMTSSTWYQAADFTIGPLQNWASGVLAWTLSTNPSASPHLSSGGCNSCYGLVTIDSPTSYTYNMAYYLLAQFSKFIPKGATILSSSASSSDLEAVASLNPDGSRTVVFVNKQESDVAVQATLSGSGGQWSGTVPQNSVVTWVLP